MDLKKILAQILIVTFSVQNIAYAGHLTGHLDNDPDPTGQNLQDFQATQQGADDRMAEKNDQHNTPSGPTIQSLPATDSDQVADWILDNQAQNTSGLLVSHPEDTSSIVRNGNQVFADTQAYTYDQAVSGIVLLKDGEIVA